MEEDEQSNQKRLRKQVMERLKMQQLELQKREVLKRLLEPAAYERLMNIRLSNPELYDQLVNLIVSLAQSNRLQGKMTEAQLLSILEKATYKPDTKIEYKHK